MPVYEFICKNCGQRFEAVQTLAEHEKGKPACPRCKTVERVETQLSSFHAHTSRKA